MIVFRLNVSPEEACSNARIYTMMVPLLIVAQGTDKLGDQSASLFATSVLSSRIVVKPVALDTRITCCRLAYYQTPHEGQLGEQRPLEITSNY